MTSVLSRNISAAEASAAKMTQQPMLTTKRIGNPPPKTGANLADSTPCHTLDKPTKWPWPEPESQCNRRHKQKGGAERPLSASIVPFSLLLRRAGGPALDQRVVVDRLALRLLVGELAGRRNVAVL